MIDGITYDSRVKRDGYELWVAFGTPAASAPKQRTVWIRDLPFIGSRSAATAHLYLN